MNRIFVLLIAATALACGNAPAQESPRHDEPTQRRGMHPDQWKNGPLERFMGQLAQENPEEFERLKQLREQDPGRLHELLQRRRDQLRAQQILKSLAELPRFREVVESLTPEERTQIQEKFSRFIGGKTDGRKNVRRPQGDRKPGDDPESQTRQLVREYRETTSERKAALRTELRIQIEAAYEQGEAERRRNIEEVEERLEKLKEIVATRAENREEIIDRRLYELTDGKI